MTATRSHRLRWPILLLLLACCALLPSCAGGPDPTFVAASRAAHDAIAPEYLHYVDADPALTPEQRQRRHATVDRWAEAIVVREQATTTTTRQ